MPSMASLLPARAMGCSRQGTSQEQRGPAIFPLGDGDAADRTRKRQRMWSMWLAAANCIGPVLPRHGHAWPPVTVDEGGRAVCELQSCGRRHGVTNGG